jgi:lysosomal alpha-mannosidase
MNLSRFSIGLILLLISLANISCKIRVHVIPHSHDDVGWLRTMDGYYTQYPYCVKCILDNVVAALSENKERTFVSVEMAFFEKWYTSQDEAKKQTVKQLIKEGRLAFANGGWVMNDEACAISQDIIDQMRLGMSFLYKEFEYVPKVAWYLDPFGHSKTNAAILSRLGFENLVMVRIDYKEKEMRIKNKELEFYWKPYDEVDGGETKIFTHITHGHYSPKGNAWDNMLSRYTLVTDSLAKEFYNYFLTEAKSYRTNNLLFLYGDDFTFSSNGLQVFHNMDNLIKTLSGDDYKDKIEIFYSTPQRYFEELSRQEVQWPEWKNFDFFPYSDDPKAYWTGYFTSRPYLKGMVRDTRNYMYHSSQLFIKYFNNPQVSQDTTALTLKSTFIQRLEELKRALAIGQHHDAVSGTAREDVSEDYISMLEKSIAEVRKSILSFLTGSNEINATICVPSVADFDCNKNSYDFKEKDEMILLFINHEGKSIVPITLRTNTSRVKVYSIENDQEVLIKSDIYCYDNGLDCYINLLLDFNEANNLYKIMKLKKVQEIQKILEKKYFTGSEGFINIYENQDISVKFDPKEGMSYRELKKNLEYKFSFEFGTYNMNGYSSIRSGYANPGGAYIMAPSSVNPDYFKYDITKSFYIDGESVFHIVLYYPDWYTKINIFKNSYFNNIIETQTVMKPLVHDNKEYLLILKSDINNISEENSKNTEFFTDTNGSMMIRRVKDTRLGWEYNKDEPVADNFYPVNSVISIRDKQRIFSVWNDRSQSASSINQGEIFLILNRKSSRDDKRGLADGLYEQRNSRGDYLYNHYITIGNNFSQKKVSSLVNKKPVIFNFELNGNFSVKNIETSLKSLIKNSFDPVIIDDNNSQCLDVDLYVQEENKFLLQITNNFSDPYFNKKVCDFELNSTKLEEKYKIHEVELNGITPVLIPFLKGNKVAHHLRGYISFRESVSVFKKYSILPYETRTFMFEIKK